MSNAIELLRMLEPAVRPGGIPGPARTGSEPIESRSFDSLLEEAKAAATSGESLEKANTPPTADPLKSLAGVDLIDNAALLRLIGSRNDAAASGNTSRSPMPAPDF